MALLKTTEIELKKTLDKILCNCPIDNVSDIVLLQELLFKTTNRVIQDELCEQEYLKDLEKASESSKPEIIIDETLTPFDEGFATVKLKIEEEDHPFKNNKIFILVSKETGELIWTITEYRWNELKFTPEGTKYQLLDDGMDIDCFVENNKEYIDKHIDIFNQLVEDKILYEDFLYLQGFEDMKPEANPFPKEGLVVEASEVIEPIIERDPIQTAKEIAERYDIANFMAEPEITPVKVHPLDIISPVAVASIPEAPTSYIRKEKPDFKLTDHQQERFDGLISKIDSIIESQRNLVRPPNPAYYMTVLEGAAGTGKTTMMVKVLEELSTRYNIIFCSPTHQALGVIRETLIENWLEFTEDNEEYLMGNATIIIKTLASFLGIKMIRDEENGTESFEEDPKAAIFTCDVLAIDESSMVSKDQLKILLKKLHINVKCILFIGDEVQLDSPSDNNESNGIFQLPQKFALEEVVRQAADNKILQLAWELRGYILAKNCPYAPSQLLHEGRTNENIAIFRDQAQFMHSYFQNEEKSKLISTYTNKITNEYNDYVRQLRLTGQGTPLDINIDGNGKNIITNWDEYREWYVGEEVVALEPNQRAGEVIHQTGEKFIIDSIKEETKKVFIEVVPDTHDLNAQPEMKEFVIPYFKIVDTKGKTIWVIKKDFTQQYNDILSLLSLEAKRKTGKFKWAKFFDIKEKFIRVNKTFGFTLHKLQGSTCKEIYVDARDLDKFWKRMPIGVYKLIYIALTRPKFKVNFLI